MLFVKHQLQNISIGGTMRIWPMMYNSFILQQYVCYTTILNMFRAARCSSSGGQIVSPQPLVSSPSVKQPYSMQVQSPCDFDLIPKMKEPLRGIRFRTVSEILQAVDRSIRTINTTGAAKGILRLPHRWQRVVHNAGDYAEGQ